MKILAIEKDVKGTDWKNSEDILKEEAHHVYNLYLDSSLREVYFTESKNAVLILETKNKGEAEKLLQELPLVKNGMISFEIFELHPYSGFQRIIGT